jgi:hypothetical protein
MASTKANEVADPMPGWVIRRVAALGFFQNCVVQLRDGRIELAEQLQKFLAPAAGPRTKRETSKFRAAFLGEQLLLPAQALAHGKKVQLVGQHGAQTYQLVTMPEQLPEVAFGRCGNPDFQKASGEQKLENEPGVALIGLLFAYFTGTNLRGVSDPQFVAEIREQTLEPVNRAGRFDAHAHRFLRTLQAPVERLSLATLVVQSPLDEQLGSLLWPWQSADSVYGNHTL